MVLSPDKLAEFRTDVSLAEYTTIHLGGNAQYFVSCGTIDEIISAVNFFQTTGDPVMILGGGSNVVFSDRGFKGLVLKVDLKGLTFTDEGDNVIVTAQAGESWDNMVQSCVDKCLAGVECLSGIPGTAGATPIQNVGAYGQEVKDTIVRVKAVDRQSLQLIEFNSEDCRFAYRSSRFKREDRDRFVIVEVSYRLKKDGEPTVRYVELDDYIRWKDKEAGGTRQEKGDKRKETGESRQETGRASLDKVREAVLALRRKKSMVIDPADLNTRSVGSFFVNPVLSEEEYSDFLARLKGINISGPPAYPDSRGTKIPAAWLVEKAGFSKGKRSGGVGISSNHALALVNFSGTSRELLNLASEIQGAVLQKFRIKLEREAVIVE